MIRIDALWACTAPVDMRAGADRLLACVVCGPAAQRGALRVAAGVGVEHPAGPDAG